MLFPSKQQDQTLNCITYDLNSIFDWSKSSFPSEPHFPIQTLYVWVVGNIMAAGVETHFSICMRQCRRRVDGLLDCLPCIYSCYLLFTSLIHCEGNCFLTAFYQARAAKSHLAQHPKRDVSATFSVVVRHSSPSLFLYITSYCVSSSIFDTYAVNGGGGGAMWVGSIF